MKALVKAQPEPGLWLEYVAEPELGINDVLVRVDRTGICGTDLSIFNWDAWARETIKVPMVVGHEFVHIGIGSDGIQLYASTEAARGKASLERPGRPTPGGG